MTKDFLETIFLSNTIKRWLIIATVIIIMLVISKGLSKLLAFISVKYFTKVAHLDFKETIAKWVVKPLNRYLFWFIAISGITRLNYPEAFRFVLFKAGLQEILLGLASAWLVICFFKLIIGILHFTTTVLKRTAMRKDDRSMLQIISLFTDLGKALLIIICILSVIKFSLKYSLAPFVTSLGLITAALALAAKESVENLICSIIILLDKPFMVDDYIKISGVSGTVEKIGLRSTLLRTDNKTIESIPNRQMAGNMLENISVQSARRYVQTLEVALDTTRETLNTLIEDIVSILQQHEQDKLTNYTAYLKSTGVNAHKIYLEYLAPAQMSLSDFHALNQTINLEIIELLQAREVVLVKYFAPAK